MPATTARKGSAAYEKGIREGQAMASRARHSTAPEPEETEEEGEEEEEMDMASTNRKRSAKGAKNTKAPMDGGMYGKKPMDNECGCNGKKGGKCDGNCGSMKKDRADSALTPHEYLAACDLGIQDRSRSYIRARLDAAERLDLKCGKGSISKGEKCTKGAATQVDPRAAAKKEFRTLMSDPIAANRFNRAKGSTKGIGNKIKAVGELAARVGGGAAMGAGLMQTFEGAMKGNLGEVSRGYRNMQLGAAATKVAAASKAGRMGKKQLSKEFLKSAAAGAAIGVGQEAAIGAVAGFNRAGGARGVARGTRRAYQAARMRAAGMRTMKRDSTYASGFSLDTDALAI